MADYRSKILGLLKQRDSGKTICPSEVLPERLKSDTDVMDEVREAARGLVSEGLIEITQKGQVIDPNKIHGPIRLRLKSH